MVSSSLRFEEYVVEMLWQEILEENGFFEHGRVSMIASKSVLMNNEF